MKLSHESCPILRDPSRLDFHNDIGEANLHHAIGVDAVLNKDLSIETSLVPPHPLLL